MKGTIFLQDLKITCIVGIFPKERELKQNLFLDIEVDYDFAKAAETEKVDYTLDYAALGNLVENFVMERKFQLIETASEEICQLIFKNWTQVSRAKVKIKKPGAVPQASYAAVEVERMN